MKTQLLALTLLTFCDYIASLHTYLTATRLREERGTPMSCNNTLSDSSSESFAKLNSDMCEALIHAISTSSLRLTHCQVKSVTCDGNLPLVYTKVSLESSNQVITSQDLHRAFSLEALVKETVVTIDYLQISDYNECNNAEDNSCHSNALCRNTNGGYTCSCKRGYTDASSKVYQAPGTLCQVTCGATSCANEGTCSLYNDQAVCKCTSDYTGQSCEVLKKDVEWVWILGITLVISTLLLVPTGVGVCIFLRTRRKTKTPLSSHSKQAFHSFSWVPFLIQHNQTHLFRLLNSSHSYKRAICCYIKPNPLRHNEVWSYTCVNAFSVWYCESKSYCWSFKNYLIMKLAD